MLLVVGDVPIDSDALVVTSSILRFSDALVVTSSILIFVGPTRFIGGAYRGRVCVRVCVHKGWCVLVCMWHRGKMCVRAFIGVSVRSCMY